MGNKSTHPSMIALDAPFPPAKTRCRLNRENRMNRANRFRRIIRFHRFSRKAVVCPPGTARPTTHSRGFASIRGFFFRAFRAFRGSPAYGSPYHSFAWIRVHSRHQLFSCFSCLSWFSCLRLALPFIRADSRPFAVPFFRFRGRGRGRAEYPPA